MAQRPASVTITLLCLWLQAGFWLVVALLVALGSFRAFASMGPLRWILAVLALGTAGFLAGLAILLQRRVRLAWLAGAAGLAALAVLSVTDQIGGMDIFTLLVSLVPLALMVKDRAWYGAPRLHPIDQMTSASESAKMEERRADNGHSD